MQESALSSSFIRVYLRPSAVPFLHFPVFLCFLWLSSQNYTSRGGVIYHGSIKNAEKIFKMLACRLGSRYTQLQFGGFPAELPDGQRKSFGISENFLDNGEVFP